MPNFLTVEDADKIPPLTPGQEFMLVARGVFDPFEFVLVGFAAGLGQASNSNLTYRQGAQGYAKRFGTSYADNAIENFMSSAVFPLLLHQDPCYYQLGHGGFLKRAGHAVAELSSRAPIPATHNLTTRVDGRSVCHCYFDLHLHPTSKQRASNEMGVWVRRWSGMQLHTRLRNSGRTFDKDRGRGVTSCDLPGRRLSVRVKH
jgi:hypothetical protein